MRAFIHLQGASQAICNHIFWELHYLFDCCTCLFVGGVSYVLRELLLVDYVVVIWSNVGDRVALG